MKRRRRYGEKYSGLPYPEDFKNKMMALFPNSKKLREALDGGWDSVHLWFNELCSTGPAVSANTILDYLAQGAGGVIRLGQRCKAKRQRRKELRALSDEWQRMVFLDDQSCDPWKEEE